MVLKIQLNVYRFWIRIYYELARECTYFIVLSINILKKNNAYNFYTLQRIIFTLITIKIYQN